MVNDDLTATTPSKSYKQPNKFERWLGKIFGKTGPTITFNIFNYIFFLIVLFVTFYPFGYVLKESFLVLDKTAGKYVFSFNSYVEVFKLEGLPWAFIYSIIIVIVSTVCNLALTILSAYPLSRHHLKGRTGILLYIIFTMLFSGGLIPYYILIRDLGLRDSSLVYIFVGMVGGFNVIIAKNFMQGIPDSLEEAAKLDGANDYVILFEIYIPLCLPIIATIALWVGVGKWNDWMTAVLYIKNDNKRLIQNFLRDILNQASSTQGVVNEKIMSMAKGLKMAVVVVGTLPVVVFYPFVQKYFVKGVIIGSVKG